MSGDDRQRIDKWLWFARVVKTRPLAQELAQSGKVRVNGRKIDSASQAVRRGDVLTIGLHGRVLLLEVAGFAERRGGYPQARLLYVDRSPVPLGPDSGEEDGETVEGEAEAGPPSAPPSSAAPVPVRGEGRPTKRDRRRLDRGSG